MLKITIESRDLWDEKNEVFIPIREQTIALEHSLVSVSKWEAKWKKPFLSKEQKTEEELLDYIRCMTITQNVDQSVYYALTDAQLQDIVNYIDDPMTATWFSENVQNQSRRTGKQVTSELIYYWMIAANIPVEFQKWHLNRLITLIRVCSLESQPPKKQSTRSIMNRNAALNAARRKKLNSKG